MLVQSSRRVVAGYDAWVERVHLRHRRFGITVLRASGIAVDWGMQAEAVRFIARMTRTQLSILLAGRGYFQHREGLWTLRPGDVVQSDQLLQEPEGYTGNPCEALLIEWDEETVFGSMHRGPPRRGRIGADVVAGLSELLTMVNQIPAELWVAKLGGYLRAMGLPMESVQPSDLTVHAPRSLAKVYGALGDVLTRMDESPALVQVADALSLTERQTLRQFKELERSFGHQHDGWRDFIHDARIGWAMQLLSLPGITHERVAKLAGYGSAIALHHALALRGAGTPGSIARRLAQRWG